MSKKGLKKAQIGGITLNSTSREEVLREILGRIEAGQKTFVATPNPEFIVFAQDHAWFKKALNQADLAIPDGTGLVLAGKLLGQPIQGRVAGADLVVDLLEAAQAGGWSVGVVGARWGIQEERRTLVKRLQKAYLKAKVFSLEETPDWPKRKIEIVFACQGMGKQEKWILEKIKKSRALLFIGVGGSLDFLTGFSRRAPLWLRKLGLEWLYRFYQEPRKHFKRILTALFIFPLKLCLFSLKRK